jgi:NTP pyrophosphatase (non-canonical NTP hydrolase)
MKIELYQESAKRTLPDLGSKKNNMIHMDLGIVTEIGEVFDILKKNHAYNKEIDLTHMGEELADISWYVVGKCTIANTKLTQEQLEAATLAYFSDEVTNYENLQNNEEERIGFIRSLLTYMLSVIVSDSEKTIIFRSPIVMIAGLRFIAKLMGIDYGTHLDKNIQKLKIRYPDKFDTERALKRDLDAERKTLED